MSHLIGVGRKFVRFRHSILYLISERCWKFQKNSNSALSSESFAILYYHKVQKVERLEELRWQKKPRGTACPLPIAKIVLEKVVSNESSSPTAQLLALYVKFLLGSFHEF